MYLDSAICRAVHQVNKFELMENMDERSRIPRSLPSSPTAAPRARAGSSIPAVYHLRERAPAQLGRLVRKRHLCCACRRPRDQHAIDRANQTMFISFCDVIVAPLESQSESPSLTLRILTRDRGEGRAASYEALVQLPAWRYASLRCVLLYPAC